MRRAVDEELASIFEESHERLIRVGYLICGSRETAEDAVIEAFTRIVPRWRKGSIDDVYAYARRSVVNYLLSRGRSDQVARRSEARLEHSDVVPGLEDSAVDRLVLWPVVQALPPRQRAVIALRYFDGLSQDETAAELGVSPGTIKSQTSKAMARLREVLTGASNDGS